MDAVSKAQALKKNKRKSHYININLGTGDASQEEHSLPPNKSALIMSRGTSPAQHDLARCASNALPGSSQLMGSLTGKAQKRGAGHFANNRDSSGATKVNVASLLSSSSKSKISTVSPGLHGSAIHKPSVSVCSTAIGARSNQNKLNKILKSASFV